MSNYPRAADHVRRWGDFSAFDPVTAEGQYPDRFGQRHISFGEELDRLNTQPPDPLSQLQTKVDEVQSLASRLVTMHRARKSVVGDSARDAAFHRAQARARDATSYAQTVIRRAQGGTPQRYEIAQVTTSLNATADLLRALIAHPTGRTG